MGVSATMLGKARSLCLGGAHKVKVEAPYCTQEELEAALVYAQGHKGSKTLIATLEREIKKKKKTKAGKA